jgi:cobyrinic acid a,c-diamide synthase
MMANVPTLVIAGTHSGVGKTTIASSLMAAFTRRGLVVQPFKVGPDFLDGMHHTVACSCKDDDDDDDDTDMEKDMNVVPQPLPADGTAENDKSHDNGSECRRRRLRRRSCINLDGWMMGQGDADNSDVDDELPQGGVGRGSGNRAKSSKKSILSSFHRHAANADICLVEGVMGLHDGKDGTCDDGSTAQIAKFLQAPVVLVVDAYSMCRSVAAMVLGYLALDPQVRLAAVIVNNVQGSMHIEWIQQALRSHADRLVDVGTHLPILFAGAMPTNKQLAIPERHLGLAMPHETNNSIENSLTASRERFIKLASIVEAHLDLDGLLRLAQTATTPPPVPLPLPPLPSSSLLVSMSDQEQQHEPTTVTTLPTTSERHITICRIGVAFDDAFNFYYHDNLTLLEQAGAELFYFSPCTDAHLPPGLDALYLGGGYPELHAEALQANSSLRLDIQSFAWAGGVVYAECGGFMYLAESLWTMTQKSNDSTSTKITSSVAADNCYDRRQFEMCRVLPGITVSMTPHMKMYYAQVQMTANNPIFPAGGTCRGQKFHFSEAVLSSNEDKDDNKNNASNAVVPVEDESSAVVQAEAPYIVTPQTPGSQPEPGGYTIHNVIASYFHLHWASRPSMAREFVDSAIRNSPFQKRKSAASFVSAATEIAFALGVGDSMLAAVTSVCDYPRRARAYPRRVVCQSPFDASQMTSEQVAVATKEHETKKKDQDRPGHWMVDTAALGKLMPAVAFVQDSCDICDAARSDVLGALQDCGVLSQCKIVQVSPTTLEGMFKSIMDVGGAMGVPEKSMSFCKALRQRLATLADKVAKQGKKRPRVLSLEGLSPLCVGGGWLPDVKSAAGCEDALGDVGGAPARIISWDEVACADPDVLIISPCSGSTDRTLNELYLLNTPEFWNLRCVRYGNVYVIDHGMFSRPGPRLVDGAEMLATLLLGVAPPDHVDTAKYYDAFKYECCVGAVRHCTTELSSRFRHCFRRGDSSNEPSVAKESEEEKDERAISSDGLRLHQIRTTPGSGTRVQLLPCDRSAHNMVSLSDGSALLFAGEDNTGRRYSDVWKLHIPSKLYSIKKYDQLDRFSIPVWELLQCTKVANEDVPTARSNSAAVVCGDYLLVFGGWGQESQCLDHCELLHLDTLCWTHCSTRNSNSSQRPCSRGNPTLLYSEKLNCAILFGGWDRTNRLSDLWRLDMDSWEWHCHGDYRGDGNKPEWPRGRTDHSAVLWTRDNGHESMIVFGGSCAATDSHAAGPSSELWILDTSNWKWQEVRQANEILFPAPRTSHSAALVGSGDLARMVILGGTGNGSGPSVLTADAWILELSNLSWQRVYLNEIDYLHLLGRCRHTMTISGCEYGEKMLVWGGYDGVATVQNDATVWFGGDPTHRRSVVNKGTKNNVASESHKKLQERWQAEIPLRESDLPADVLAKAMESSLPGAVYKALHRHAVSLKRDTYLDPATGYSVFTQIYLKRRPCCGNGCRHCPHGHINCPDNNAKLESPAQSQPNCTSGCDDPELEW